MKRHCSGICLTEIQNVYRSQNVTINDKHIEVIISQMMRKVEIESVGDSSFLPGEVVDRFGFRRANDELAKSIRISDPGETDLKEGTVITKEELEPINEKIELLGRCTCQGQKAASGDGKDIAFGYYQGLAAVGKLYFGGKLPGNNKSLD